MSRYAFLFAIALFAVSACGGERRYDREAADFFQSNAARFLELNTELSALPKEIRSLEPGAAPRTMRVRRKPDDDELVIEDSSDHTEFLGSFQELDLALISRFDGYSVFHRNPIRDGQVEHYYEYISMPVANESMRCGGSEAISGSVRSCLADLDFGWSMWIKTLPGPDSRKYSQ